MKFNVGAITSEDITVAHVVFFENGMILRSQPIEWLGINEQKKVADNFEEVLKEMLKGNLEFDSSFNTNLFHKPKSS